MTRRPRRLGAYLLTGDPTWLAASLARYYDRLDDLVALVPADGRSWTGRPLPVEDCLAAIRSVDHRGLARVVEDVWTDPAHPATAETAQRQAGLDHLAGVDWVLQLDNDEVLAPSALEPLDALLDRAEAEGLDVVEWPMRVLYRGLGRGRFLEVVARDGRPFVEYPGPIAVRPGVRLVDCRRTAGPFLRPVVAGDRSSVQVTRDAEPGEHRVVLLEPRDVITHNSWGRPPRAIWRKLRSSAHRLGWRGPVYFALVWLPSPWTWRLLRGVHPLSRDLWPRLRPTTLVGVDHPGDRR